MLTRRSVPAEAAAPRGTRRGFTLIEATVAMLILSILVAGLMKLIVTQGRFFDHQTNYREARSIARNSINVVVSDLRIVQDSGGIDSASTDGKTIRLIVPYRFGMICKVTGTTTTLMMLPVDSASNAMATHKGFAWRGSGGRYTLVTTTVAPTTAASSNDCTGSGAGQANLRAVTIQGRSTSYYDVQPAATGAVATNPVFFYQRITYTFASSSAYPGKVGLWRIVDNGTNEELLAPFDTSARFKFFTAGSDASVTTPPSLDQIRGVELILTSISPKTAARTGDVAKVQMQTAVFFKNMRSF